jgi:uncharacterized DUF497 family protein
VRGGDDAKRRQVKRGHGIDLALLPEAFSRPTVEMEAQPHWQDGLRYKMLGLADQTVVVVIYVERDNGLELRLITAWEANRVEQSLYYSEDYSEVFGEGY